MPTIAWDSNGYETNTTLSTYFTATGGTVSIDTTDRKNGTNSFKCASSPAYGRRPYTSGNVVVLTTWVKLDALPSAGIEVISLGPGPTRIGYDATNQKWGVIAGTSQNFSGTMGPTVVAGQWYRIDVRVDSRANPWIVDWMVDGVTQPQFTNASAAAPGADVYLGHPTGFSVTLLAHFDDTQISLTYADYPLSVPPTPVTGTDSGQGTDAGTVLFGPFSGTDTGTGAEATSLVAKVSDTDSGSGTESATVTVALSASDTGTGTDSASVTVPGYEYDQCGDTTIYAGRFSDTNDWMRVTKYTVARSGTLIKVTPYTDTIGASGPVHWRAVVYADNAGSPGALLGTSADATLAANSPAAWYDSQPLSIPVTAGQVIYIGKWAQPNIAIFYLAGAPGQTQFDPPTSPTYSTTLPAPDPFPSPAPYAQGNSIYATIAVPSGGTPKSGSDTGTGADSGSVSASLTVTDTGVGTETFNRGITSADIGIGADSQQASSGSINTSSDAGTGVDAIGALSRQLQDSGTGADSSTLGQALTSADVGSGVDSATISQSVTSADAGLGTDTETLRKRVTDGDFGHGEDFATTAAPFPPAPHKPIELTPAPHEPFQLTSILHRGLSWGPKGVYYANIESGDNGHGADSQGLFQTPTVGVNDGGVASESGLVLAHNFAADVARGVEAYSLQAAGNNFSFDLGEAVDQASLVAREIAQDYGVFTDLGVQGSSDSVLGASDASLGIDLGSLRAQAAGSDTGHGTDTGTKTIKSTPVAFIGERGKGGDFLSTGSDSFTIAVSGITAGNQLFVALGANKSAVNLTVTDNAGNSYLLDYTVTLSPSRVGVIFSAQINTAPTVITITGNNTSGAQAEVAFKIEEFQGIRPGKDIAIGDQSSIAVDGTTIPSMNAAASGELEVGMCSSVGQSFVSLTGAAQAGTPRNASPDCIFWYKIGAADPTAAITCQFATSSSFVAIGALYVPTG